MAIGTLILATAALSMSMVTLLYHSGTMTTATAPPALLNRVLPDLLLFSAMELLVTTIAFTYGHMQRVAGNRNRRISDFLTFFLCLYVSILLFFLFVMQPPGGANDATQQSRALGLVAVRALLPEAATSTLVLGMMLIYAHLGNGVVPADGGDVAGGGPAPAPAPAVCALVKITLGAAAAVARMVSLAAFYTK